jgi:hypothetical protein
MEEKKEKPSSKAKCDRMFPNAWRYGTKIAFGFLAIWLGGWGLVSLGSYLLGNPKNSFSGWGINNGLPVCDGAADVMLSENQPRVEQKQSYNCLSGMIALPADIQFDYYVPGDTRVFACNARGCRESFSIRDLDGRRDIQDRKFPRAFRLMGHPGTAWFKLRGFEAIPMPLGRPGEMDIERIRRSVEEIKSLRKKNNIK